MNESSRTRKAGKGSHGDAVLEALSHPHRIKSVLENQRSRQRRTAGEVGMIIEKCKIVDFDVGEGGHKSRHMLSS